MFKAKNLWIIHVLGWILFLSLPLTIMSREPDRDMQQALLTSGSFWLFFLIYCTIFYGNLLFLIPTLLLKQRYAFYAAVFIAGFVLIYIGQPFEKLIFQQFRERSRTEMRPPPPPPADFAMPGPPAPGGPQRNSPVRVDFVSLVLFVIVCVLAMAIRFSQQWRASEKRAILSEADKAQAELSFFKAQINPHFLFNTLNNIYAMAVISHANTAPSILKLSKMMRYITEEATEDYVLLEDEIACLNNYIDLQKLRLNSKTSVQFEVRGSSATLRITPLVLMTFVENAFKYGVSGHNPVVIEIGIDITGKDIHFYCQNQIVEARSDTERQGLGIANTRKRLDFLYPDLYDLRIRNEEKTFRVDLKLKSV